jgi:hypothetical protein
MRPIEAMSVVGLKTRFYRTSNSDGAGYMPYNHRRCWSADPDSGKILVSAKPGFHRSSQTFRFEAGAFS